jgi:hypothetical protein
MQITKRVLIEDAFDDCSLWDGQLQPEHIQKALRQLDQMVARWNSQGVRLRYDFYTNYQNSSLDDVLNVPDEALEALRMQLAKRIAPSFGKQLDRSYRVDADKAYNDLRLKRSKPGVLQLPSTMPRGSGHKTHKTNQRRFYGTPIEPLDSGVGDTLDFS